jgi:dTDP-4-dehydrorhamnose reductase
MRAMVTGASGFLGRTILSQLGPNQAAGTYHSNPGADLVHFDAVQHRFADLKSLLPGQLTHVFLTHGAVNPELCARDPEGTAKINVESMIRLLSEIVTEGVTPVFLSTDYVFDDSCSLRSEDEMQTPKTEYGRQKAAVEQWLQTRHEPWLVVRLSKVVSGDRRTHSLLGQWINDICQGKTMRSAIDQVFSPAHVDDVAGAMIRLASRGLTGIYHVAGPDPISRYDLNKLLIRCIQSVDPAVRALVEPCNLRDIGFMEQRSLNTSLSTEKLKQALDYPLRSMTQVCYEIAQSEFKIARRRPRPARLAASM